MARSSELSPGEAVVLLALRRSKPRDALKVTLLSLIARGYLLIEQVPRRWRIFGKTAHFRVVRNDPPAAPHEAAVFEAIRHAEARGYGKVWRALSDAQNRFGTDYRHLKYRHIMPELVGRGLVIERVERVLGLFRRTLHALTPGGEVVRAEIERKIEQARRIPELLKTDPKDAAAIALAAGGMIFLVPELKSHYAELGRVVHAESASGGGEYEVSFSIGDGQSTLSFGTLLDSAFDVIDSGASALDAGGDGGGNGGD
jgi:hypothetical protein